MRQVDATLWRPRDLSSLEGKLATAATSGGTPLVVSWKHKPRGVITLYDSVKDDAANAVSDLERWVWNSHASRDTYPVARRFADNLGISKVLAGIALGKKEIAVRSVHARGANVALVGETSVLDCMRVADVGILMGNQNRWGSPRRTWWCCATTSHPFPSFSAWRAGSRRLLTATSCLPGCTTWWPCRCRSWVWCTQWPRQS